MSLQLVATGAWFFAFGTVVDVAVEFPAEAASLPTTVITLQDGDATTRFRVPGDNQQSMLVLGVPHFDVGSEWAARLTYGERGYVPRGLGEGLERLDAAPRWNVNEVEFPPESLPLTWRLLEPGSTDLGLDATEAAMDVALQRWNEVGCSDFVFARGDSYTPEDIVPGDSWVRWREDDWDADPAIAGVTGIFFDQEFAPLGATMEYNGVHWTWVEGRGNAYLPAPEVNIDSVVTHEMGHAAGLAHEVDLVAATMYFAYFGGDWQASIAGDDRRGLCELYDNGRDDCATDDDCEALGPGHFCAELDGVRVCDEARDGLGAECSVEYINCGEYCVLDRPQEGAGYCSVTCEAGSCPDGYACGLIEDVLLPTDQGVALCFPLDSSEDDENEEEDDVGAVGCSDCGGSVAFLPLLLIGFGPRRRRGRLR